MDVDFVLEAQEVLRSRILPGEQMMRVGAPFGARECLRNHTFPMSILPESVAVSVETRS